MESCSERLELIVEKSGEKSVSSFADAIGGNQKQVLYDIKNGKIKSISANLSKIIVSRFPQFNPEWVMYGTGETLLKKPTPLEKEVLKLSEPKMGKYSARKSLEEKKAEYVQLTTKASQLLLEIMAEEVRAK